MTSMTHRNDSYTEAQHFLTADSEYYRSERNSFECDLRYLEETPSYSNIFDS